MTALVQPNIATKNRLFLRDQFVFELVRWVIEDESVTIYRRVSIFGHLRPV